MKGFFLFLIVAFPIVLASPTFWWLVQSEYGAAPATIIEHDGVERLSYLGPKSPWPAWVPLPQSAQLRVRSWYADAPGHPGVGFGDLQLARPVQEEIAAIKAQLASQGWTVTTELQRTVTPDLPPRRLMMCTVRGVRNTPARTVMYAFQLEPELEARVFWTSGPPLPAWNAVAKESC